MRSEAGSIAEAVSGGEREALGPAREALERIREGDGGEEGLNAFLSVQEESDLASTGEGPLAGVPIAVKDNLCTLDLPTSCASRILEGWISPFEATAVRRLREAGAVIVGKTNMDEFAMGSSTENSAYGPTRNPADPERVPGGSSGGSAAAVAAGWVPIALGSDTGGSVRQPAALCGVVGVKPTYGRVSRYGLVAFGSSLDQIGTFGRTVADAALTLQVISGPDPRDATCAPVDAPDLLGSLDRGVAGRTIGVPEEYVGEGLDPAVRERFDAALERFRELGATVTSVSLPHTHLAIPTYYVLAPAEASSNLSRYDGVRYGVRSEEGDIGAMYEATRDRFGPEVRRRILLGTYALSAGYYDAYYATAQRARSRIAQDFSTAFETVDLIFTPTTPSPAFRLGERSDDPLAMYLSDVYTVTANLAGVPGVSLPIGTVAGLPVGGQLLGPWWGEDGMLAAASALESVSGGQT